MKKFIVVIVLVALAVGTAYAGGGKVRGDKGKGKVVQIEGPWPERDIHATFIPPCPSVYGGHACAMPGLKWRGKRGMVATQNSNLPDQP